MFTAGGQPQRIGYMAVRGGGGKGGASQQAAPQPRTYVDPVDGTVFAESPLDAMGLGSGLSAADQYNKHVTDRRATETAKSAADTAQAATDKATAHTNWLGQRDTAYGNALTNVQQSFRDAGLDPSQYMDQYINPALNTAKSSIMDDSPNPGAAFSPTLGETILGNVTNASRNKATTDFSNVFKPDYANTLLPDTGLDTSANTILDEQFTPVQGQLENAFKRNTLDQTGYNAALGALGNKRSAALGTVRDLGRNILNEDRGYINDIISGGRNDIAGLRPNQTFDPLTYDTQARSRAASETGSFGGELRSKVGDSKFVDLTELLNAGGAAQGALNPSAINPTPMPGLGNPFEEEAKKNRGLGNTGAF